MRLAPVRLRASRWLLTAVSIGLFLTVGLNYGIDFSGGTLIEAKTTQGPADLAAMRAKLDGLHFGEASLQEFGSAGRRADPPAAAARRRRGADEGGRAGAPGARARASTTAAPRSSARASAAELIRAGVLATVLALVAILVYVWFRFEWQFGVGATLSTIHDVDHDGRPVRDLPARVQPDDPGGDPDHRRLFDQRHGGDLRPGARDRCASTARCRFAS